MSFSHRFAAIAVTCLLTSFATAQRTFVVAANGEGQFLEIQPAIAAAQPGDTVLVRAGAYPFFVLDKGIRILGDPGVVVGPAFFAFFVRGVPAGQTAVLRRINGDPTTSTTRVTLENSEGHVHLEDLDAVGGMQITDCDQVSLTRVTTQQSVLITRSNVAASECTVQGAALNAGLDIIDSEVVFAGGSCTGATSPVFFPPTAGVRLDGGTLVLTGDAATTITAGIGMVGVPAVEVTAGTAVIAPGLTLVPSSGSPAIVSAGTVENRTVPFLTASVSGRRLVAELLAPGAAFAFLAAGLPQSPPASLPFGALWVQLAPHVVVLPFPSLAGGRGAIGISLPLVRPGAIGALQGVVIGFTTFELSTPVILTLDG